MKYELIKFTHFIPLNGVNSHLVDIVQNVEAQADLFGILIGRDLVPWAAILVARPAVSEPQPQAVQTPDGAIKMPGPPEKRGGRK